MTDRVINKLTIRGHHKDIEQCFNTIKGENNTLDFQKIIPIPEEITSAGGDTMTKWCIQHYGIKWDTGLIISNDWGFSPNIYEVMFESPWVAPSMVLIHLSKKYPQLVFTLETDDPFMTGTYKIWECYNGLVKYNCIDDKEV